MKAVGCFETSENWPSDTASHPTRPENVPTARDEFAIMTAWRETFGLPCEGAANIDSCS